MLPYTCTCILLQSTVVIIGDELKSWAVNISALEKTGDSLLLTVVGLRWGQHVVSVNRYGKKWMWKRGRRKMEEQLGWDIHSMEMVSEDFSWKILKKKYERNEIEGEKTLVLLLLCLFSFVLYFLCFCAFLFLFWYEGQGFTTAKNEKMKKYTLYSLHAPANRVEAVGRSLLYFKKTILVSI